MDHQVNEAFSILKAAVQKPQEPQDACDVFGQHVANKPKRYFQQARNIT